MEFLNLGTTIILDLTILLCCKRLSCVLKDEKKNLWSLFTRCHLHPLPQLEGKRLEGKITTDTDLIHQRILPEGKGITGLCS